MQGESVNTYRYVYAINNSKVSFLILGKRLLWFVIDEHIFRFRGQDVSDWKSEYTYGLLDETAVLVPITSKQDPDLVFQRGNG